MKVLVAIKRVVDPNVNVVVKPDGTGIDLTNTKMAVNPFCGIGIEEAVRLREAGTAEEVIAVTVGGAKCPETLRVCLAQGADRAIHIEADDDVEPLAIAKLVKAVYEREEPKIVMFGKQSIDGDNGQTGQMFAQLTGLPQATFASELTVDGDTATVTREVDGGLQTIKTSIPMVLTTDLRLNEPRYASLPNIMQARKKPIETVTPADLGVEVQRHTEVLDVSPPPGRAAGIKVESVDELVDKLRNDAKVIA